MLRVCFCADDYGLNASVSEGILALAKQQRLQAVSCMTQASNWFSDAERLKPYHDTLDIGLHFNLTHAFAADTFHLPLNQLMLKAWTRQLDRSAILTTLTQQWEQFESVMQRQPDFIDGHQHVHQFPVIRQILVEFLIQKQFKGWVRGLHQVQPTTGYFLKSKLLMYLGAQGLHHLCQAHQLHQNSLFAGIYDFSQQAYAPLVRGWLSKAQHGLLIMCHPALSIQADDTIAVARKQEYDYLSSQQFSNDCTQYHIEPTRMSQLI